MCMCVYIYIDVFFEWVLFFKFICRFSCFFLLFFFVVCLSRLELNKTKGAIGFHSRVLKIRETATSGHLKGTLLVL